MIWYLFAMFIVLAFVLVYLGLNNPRESSQALIGFTFLFLLSFTVMGNNLEYKTGEQINNSYDGSGNIVSGVTTYELTAYDDDTGAFTTHRFGYFLAVISVIGFVGVMVGLRGDKNEF